MVADAAGPDRVPELARHAAPQAPIRLEKPSALPISTKSRSPLELRVQLSSGVVPSGAAYCEKVIREMEARTRRGEKSVVVFDLDNTSFDTRPRTLAALVKFDEQNGTSYFDQLQNDQVGRDGRETATGLGLPPDVVAKVASFWDKEFWDGRSFAHDVPIKEVMDLAWRAQKAGAQIVYLTGRIEALRAPSVDELARGGFPNPDNVVLKPDLSVKTHAFKAEWLDRAAQSAFLGWYLSDSGREIEGILSNRDALPCVRVDHPLGRDGSGAEPVPVLSVRT